MNMADQFHLNRLRGELKRDEPMARHVSWRAGGNADRFYTPVDDLDLSDFIRELGPAEELLFVGLGSNLLVRDGGFRGTVISLHGAVLRPELRDGLIWARAGVAAPKVARFAALHSLAGAEFLAGIPGTVGGALAMNAGCYGAETWQVVETVQTIDRSGVIRDRTRNEFEVAYRQCRPKGEGQEWFLGAYFRLGPGNGEASRARIKEFLSRRIGSQPLSLPNAGSVFRNPPGDHAARLIEACGLKGFARGGARVSEKHANFIVNPRGAARASDIEWLILEVRRIVLEKQGVELIAEVRIVGEPA
jgi:UDP-N-acetylmuramate dehydrogenase